MISISNQNWEELLNQLEDLIQVRISDLRNSSPDINKQRLMKPLADFRTEFISENIGIKLGKEEELICLIALLPYLIPGYFDSVVSRMFPEGTELQELGGVKGANHRGFIPTGETALFLIAGNDVNLKMQAMQYFNSDHIFARKNILRLENTNEGEPHLSGRIVLNSDILEKLLSEGVSRPKLSTEFPAKYISTKLEWSNLVINETTMVEVETIRNWIACHESMINEWDLKHKFKEGYKALFYGPPGTGKTFTSTLLGKQFNRDVYRIYLSQVVSKYIGETEKNLEKIFQKAEDKNWILFFDEADALFGKRTSVSSAHDRYANQETSYLLQRIEGFRLVEISLTIRRSICDPSYDFRVSILPPKFFERLLDVTLESGVIPRFNSDAQ